MQIYFTNEKTSVSYKHLIEKPSLVKGCEIKINMDPDFKRIMGTIYKVMKLSYLDLFLKPRISKSERDPYLLLVSRFIENNSVSFNSYEVKARNYHPLLPISISHTKNQAHIRILSRDTRNALDIERFSGLMINLIYSVKKLNLKFLQSFGLENLTGEERFESICDWLFWTIVSQDDGFPIAGKIHLKENIAPWDKVEDDESSIQIFGPLKLVLIKYFSENISYPCSVWVATFVITSWYKKFLPHEFSNMASKSNG